MIVDFGDAKPLIILSVKGSSVDFNVNREVIGRLNALDRARIARALQEIIRNDFKVLPQ